MMGEEDYARLAELKTTRLQKDQRFDQLSSERDRLTLTVEDLASVIEVWTGIPASSISDANCTAPWPYAFAFTRTRSLVEASSFDLKYL